MPRFWNKLNGRIRYQVYLRVLPVVVLAVLLVGVFGWVQYTDRTTQAAIKLQKQELESLLTALRYRAGMMAMSVESRKAEFRGRAGREDLPPDQCCAEPWVQDLLQSPLVAGVVQLPRAAGQDGWRPHLCMVDSLSDAATLATLIDRGML